MFNNNVIYYISHRTSYKTFDERKNEKLLVLEITLNNEDIVEDIKNYSNMNDFEINVSKKKEDKNINFKSFWKDITRTFTRKHYVD